MPSGEQSNNSASTVSAWGFNNECEFLEPFESPLAPPSS